MRYSKVSATIFSLCMSSSAVPIYGLAFPTADLSNAIRRLRGHNQLVVESLMVPLLVIVLRVLKDRAPQMGLAQRNQTVQAFSLSRKHKSLRESVQVRTVSR